MRGIVLFKDIIYICISLAASITGPAIAPALGGQYNIINFTDPLTLSRGRLFPKYRDSGYLSHTESCLFTQKEWGWKPESCDNIENIIISPYPGIDTVIIQKPNTNGYVKLDDWNDSINSNIDGLWDAFVKSVREQNNRSGKTIIPIKWMSYPTISRENNFIYYAILITFDGSPTINAKAIYFDRFGYIPISIVPENPNASSAETHDMIKAFLSSYQSNKADSYAEFKSGDKIAAVGAVGVLASVLGVKYGKAAAVGIFALAMIFIKKIGFFLVFLPLIFLGKIAGYIRSKFNN